MSRRTRAKSKGAKEQETTTNEPIVQEVQDEGDNPRAADSSKANENVKPGNEQAGTSEASTSKLVKKNTPKSNNNGKADLGKKMKKIPQRASENVLKRQFELQLYINSWFLKTRRNLEVDVEQFQSHMVELMDIDLQLSLSGFVTDEMRQRMDTASAEIDEVCQKLNKAKDEITHENEKEPKSSESKTQRTVTDKDSQGEHMTIHAKIGRAHV